jgi:hypothetical protein
VTLDNYRTVILAADEYDYVVVSQARAEIWVSPRTMMSRVEIAAELRRVANFVESTGE